MLIRALALELWRRAKATAKQVGETACSILPEGRVGGLTAALGGLGGATAGAEYVVNYNSGQVSAFAYMGGGFGWNGMASASGYTGLIWGNLSNSNANYGGKNFAGAFGSPVGPFGASSTSQSSLLPNFQTVTAGVTGGLSLSPVGSFGTSTTVSTPPLQLGKYWAFTPLDAMIYSAKQGCK